MKDVSRGAIQHSGPSSVTRTRNRFAVESENADWYAIKSYRLGIMNRKATMNAARSVTHRREVNNRVRFLTEEEEKKLCEVVEKWPSHLPELDLAIHTGLRNLRKGSQYLLTWDMVDWKSRELHIPRN